ncbi:MAG: hypothetical protein CVV42_03060 [Candidatus Riflebacteria bacterium HGW-Riflebacteria-2]|jgi:hypothetical protein|nr:MAG: hypothetical protein CVV42_03060 [Candidatus Riflebacteria bacterium HGW-Riflebacteria-2]
MVGVFSLYRGGSKLSNTTLWAQQTINKLKLACREINNAIKKSTYPASITFPGSISENTGGDFGLHHFNGTMYATQTVGINGNGFSGAKVFSLTESTPAKIGFAASDNHDAVLIYHVVSLASDGNLNYGRWQETVAGTSVSAMARPALPTGANIFKSILARDVESVTCEPTSVGSARSPLLIKITCRIPGGETSRTEQAVGTPNVDLISHNNVGGW